MTPDDKYKQLKPEADLVNGYDPFEDGRLRSAESHEQWIHDSIQARFFTAAESGAPTVAEREVVTQFAEATRSLARLIEKFAPAGRDKSIALTDLESVLMRANRAVFAAKVQPTEPPL